MPPNLIRTRFASSAAGSENAADDSSVSPTSVAAFPPAKDGKNDELINQLRRQLTNLEHEKASMEQELLNQINTVVFDKETIVTTLQEKLTESENRYKEERKAHADTRAGLRKERISSQGEAKFEVLRLQDQIKEMTREKDLLRIEYEKWRTEKKKESQMFLDQLSSMKIKYEQLMSEKGKRVTVVCDAAFQPGRKPQRAARSAKDRTY
jgi:small-conductance mechanosensitive channel